MKITTDYIVNLSDEELRKLNRQQLIRRLKFANKVAEDRRYEALKYLDENPDTPTPLVYKKYTKWVKPKHGAIDWRNYDFDYENGESLKSLQEKLQMTRLFLSRKTSSIEGWLNSIKEFTIELAKKLEVDIRIDELVGRKYKRLWRVYNLINEENVPVGTKYQESEKLIELIYNAMTQPYHPEIGENATSYGVEALTKLLKDIIKPELRVSDYEKKLYDNAYSGLGRQG